MNSATSDDDMQLFVSSPSDFASERLMKAHMLEVDAELAEEGALLQLEELRLKQNLLKARTARKKAALLVESCSPGTSYNPGPTPTALVSKRYVRQDNRVLATVDSTGVLSNQGSQALQESISVAGEITIDCESNGFEVPQPEKMNDEQYFPAIAADFDVPPEPKVERRRHKGPVKVEFMTDKRARQKCYSKRKKTLLKQAKTLSILTGCKVQMKIEWDRGKTVRFDSHPARRHVAMQVGKRMVAAEPSSHQAHSESKTTPAKPWSARASTPLKLVVRKGAEGGGKKGRQRAKKETGCKACATNANAT